MYTIEKQKWHELQVFWNVYIVNSLARLYAANFTAIFQQSNGLCYWYHYVPQPLKIQQSLDGKSSSWQAFRITHSCSHVWDDGWLHRRTCLLALDVIESDGAPLGRRHAETPCWTRLPDQSQAYKQTSTPTAHFRNNQDRLSQIFKVSEQASSRGSR